MGKENFFKKIISEKIKDRYKEVKREILRMKQEEEKKKKKGEKYVTHFEKINPKYLQKEDFKMYLLIKELESNRDKYSEVFEKWEEYKKEIENVDKEKLDKKMKSRGHFKGYLGNLLQYIQWKIDLED